MGGGCSSYGATSADDEKSKNNAKSKYNSSIGSFVESKRIIKKYIVHEKLEKILKTLTDDETAFLLVRKWTQKWIKLHIQS